MLAELRDTGPFEVWQYQKGAETPAWLGSHFVGANLYAAQILPDTSSSPNGPPGSSRCRPGDYLVKMGDRILALTPTAYEHIFRTIP